MRPLEATYLAWLDARAMGMPTPPRSPWTAGVWSSGRGHDYQIWQVAQR